MHATSSNSIRRARGFVPPRWLSPVLVVLALEAASRAGLIPPRVLAAPSAVLAAGWRIAASGELGRHLLVSLGRAGAGFAIGAAIGIALALLAGLSRAAEALIDPLMQVKRALPIVALVPLLILWFGIGETPKIAIIAISAIFPVYIALFAGIRGGDHRLIEAGRAYGLTRREMVTQIILPGALPGLFTGLRYASAVALLLLVVAEQVNAQSGLGYLISDARDFLRTDVIVLCLGLYAALGIATDWLLRLVERRALAWRPAMIGAV